MAAVSNHEYLEKVTGRQELEDLDENIGQHEGEDPRKRRGHPAGRRDWRRTPDGSNHVVAPGSDIPDFPAPLPSDGFRVDHAPVPDQVPLDPGTAKPAYAGMMAHGVAAPIQYGGRPAPKPADRTAHEATAVPEPPIPGPGGDMHPVPVYIVSEGSGSRPLVRMATKQVIAPVAGSQPVQIAGWDPKRTRVRILNEDATNGIRIGVGPTSETGVLLPAVMTAYEEFCTQDTIWVVSNASATVKLSVIIEYSVPGGA